jgi:hypothetical protein
MGATLLDLATTLLNIGRIAPIVAQLMLTLITTLGKNYGTSPLYPDTKLFFGELLIVSSLSGVP